MRTASHSIAAEAAPTLVTLPARSARSHPEVRMPRCFPAPPGGRAVSNGRRDDRPRRPLPRAHIAARLPRSLRSRPGPCRPLSRAVACPGVGRVAMRSDTRSPRSARVVAWAVRVALPRPLRFRWTVRPGLVLPSWRAAPWAGALLLRFRFRFPAVLAPVPGAWRAVTSRSPLLQFPSDGALPGCRRIGTRLVPEPSSGAGGARGSGPVREER